jgi:hypothetical protein
MVQKAHSLTKFWFLVFFLILLSCQINKKEDSGALAFTVNVSEIPNTSKNTTDTLLKLNNGVYYYKNKVYSGYLKTNYPNDSIQLITSVFHGKKHGFLKHFSLTEN